MPNIFGGGNKNSLYTPMTDDEREVLQRLVDSDDLEVVIKDWGVVNKFKSIKFGDLRLQLIFTVFFSSPSIYIPVKHFDLVLRTRSGMVLYEDRQPIEGEPLMVGAGVEVGLCWDIAIRNMDPKLVKTIKPGALGLTTREGNRKLNEKEATILSELRKGEEKIKKEKLGGIS